MSFLATFVEGYEIIQWISNDVIITGKLLFYVSRFTQTKNDSFDLILVVLTGLCTTRNSSTD